MPEDVHIISCHSMHGPGVDPTGQPLIVIKHRATDEKLDLVLKILSCFNSNIAQLSAEEHDRITADTQAVTHAAFLTMGSAWKANNQFPVSNIQKSECEYQWIHTRLIVVITSFRGRY